MPGSGPVPVGCDDSHVCDLSHRLSKRQQPGSLNAVVVCKENMHSPFPTRWSSSPERSRGTYRDYLFARIILLLVGLDTCTPWDHTPRDLLSKSCGVANRAVQVYEQEKTFALLDQQVTFG